MKTTSIVESIRELPAAWNPSGSLNIQVIEKLYHRAEGAEAPQKSAAGKAPWRPLMPQNGTPSQAEPTGLSLGRSTSGIGPWTIRRSDPIPEDALTSRMQ